MIVWRSFFWTLVACMTSGISADKAPFSTSVVTMSKLQLLREQLVSSLSDYADKLQDKINFIHSSLTQIQREYHKSRRDPEAFLSNPLNAFSLIRHMHKDWANWQLYMEEIVGQDQILKVDQLIATLPTSLELTRTLEAMQRIQQVYNLRIEDFANGVVQGRFYGFKLTAIESFTVGLNYFEKHDFPQAAKWFKLTTQHFTNDFSDVFEFLGVSHVEAYLMYARALLNQDRQLEALQVVEDGLIVDPQNAKLLSLRADIEIRLRTAFTAPIKPIQKKVSFIEQLCRGSLQRLSRLSCRYNKVNSPFLHLAPFKTEELQLDPLTVLFHDVIYSSEMELLKKIAWPLLDATSPEDDSTFSQVFLKSNHCTTTNNINRRVNDMFGFNQSNSDGFKLINYGLDGRITQNSNESSSIVGSALFYLSEAYQGGATVLPNLNTTIFPLKGSALLWMNVRNDGTFDSKSVPVACPVIVGSKWVMMKDIYSDGEVLNHLNCDNKYERLC